MIYKKVDANSQNTITTALNIFETPPTNVSFANSGYREYLTLNPVNDKPYKFKIHPTSSYIDVSKIFILTEMRIRKRDKDGSLIDLDATADVVAPIQMLGSTFIKNMKIAINGRETFNSNGLYAYKAYLDYELSYPVSVKETYLGVQGYAKDGVDQNAVTGDGYIKRKNMFASSKTVQFMAKIDADLFNQELYMVNNVEIDIEIIPHESKFLLISKKVTTPVEYVLEMIACKLYVKHIDLMDGLALDVALRLDHEPARYGIRKSILTNHFITEGRTEFNINLFNDQIPRRIILAMVANSAYNGTGHHSPFNFENFNAREVTISANGRNYPQVPYQLDYDNQIYARAYHDMFENLGLANTTDTNGITYKMFMKGWNIYVFNMNKSGENDNGFDLITEGTTAVKIVFNNAIPTGGVTLICYGEFDSLLMVDKNRSITSDLTIN